MWEWILSARGNSRRNEVCPARWAARLIAVTQAGRILVLAYHV